MVALRQVETTQQQFPPNTQTPTQQNIIFLTFTLGCPPRNECEVDTTVTIYKRIENEARGGPLPLTPPPPTNYIF